ncbi:MAG: hypothetical protein D6805_02305 [Planctomycetota bacterium]|nr:MAG: hypothetical protein D6805_02305 [Planctomycetota bacterium]
MIYVQELQENWEKALQSLEKIQPPEGKEEGVAPYQKEWAWPLMDRAKIELALGKYGKAFQDVKTVYLSAKRARQKRQWDSRKVPEVVSLETIMLESSYVMALAKGLKRLKNRFEISNSSLEGDWWKQEVLPYLKQYLLGHPLMKNIRRQKQYRENPDQAFLRKKLHQMFYRQIEKERLETLR